MGSKKRCGITSNTGYGVYHGPSGGIWVRTWKTPSFQRRVVVPGNVHPAGPFLVRLRTTLPYPKFVLYEAFLPNSNAFPPKSPFLGVFFFFCRIFFDASGCWEPGDAVDFAVYAPHAETVLDFHLGIPINCDVALFIWMYPVFDVIPRT